MTDVTRYLWRKAISFLLVACARIRNIQSCSLSTSGCRFSDLWRSFITKGPWIYCFSCRAVKNLAYLTCLNLTVVVVMVILNHVQSKILFKRSQWLLWLCCHREYLLFLAWLKLFLVQFSCWLKLHCVHVDSHSAAPSHL